MARPSLILVLAALVLGTSVAQAQLPGVGRKLKDAARRATGQQDEQHRPPPKFDNTILELTPQVVTRLIAGLEARSKTAGAGGQTAGELRRRAAAASDEADSLNNHHSDDRARWVSANDSAESCVSDQLSNVEQRHSQEMQQRFAGMTGVNTADKMKFMQDWTAASQEAQRAAMANDTAGIRRAQQKMNTLLGFDPHSDTLKARAACHVPPMPAWMRRADSLSALGDTLAVRARGVEGAGNAAAARAAGMTPEQFAMAAERAEGFVVVHESGKVGSLYVFTDTEEQALTARLPDLKRYLG